MIGSNGNQLSEMSGFLKKGKLYLDTRNVLKAIQFSNVDLGFSDKKIRGKVKIRDFLQYKLLLHGEQGAGAQHKRAHMNPYGKKGKTKHYGEFL